MKGDEPYLVHICDRCERMEEFYQSFRDQDAIIRSLEIIGEAVTHVSTACKEASPKIPWKEMKDLRNVLIHQYFIVDPEEVWAISSHDIPELYAEVQRLLKTQ